MDENVAPLEPAPAANPTPAPAVEPVSSFHEAWVGLHNFAVSFVAPIAALLPVLEKARDAEAFVREHEQAMATQTAQIHADLADAQKRLEQAIADRQAAIASIEHDRNATAAALDADLATRQQKVQAQIDDLYKNLEAKRVQVVADAATLDAQIDTRKQVQRELDAEIAQKQTLLATITANLTRAIR